MSQEKRVKPNKKLGLLLFLIGLIITLGCIPMFLFFDIPHDSTLGYSLKGTFLAGVVIIVIGNDKWTGKK